MPCKTDIPAQIQKAKTLLGPKGEGLKYIAYFQSFTGTYGDIDRLENIYLQSARQPDIVAVSIATRPDCLGKREIDMIKRITEIIPVWVEIGLQTIHPQTAKRINRCYDLSVYDRAMSELEKMDVHRITHVILGLPGESREQMLKTVRYAGEHTDGIKLQLLHVLKDTALFDSYRRGEFETLEPEEYFELVADALELLPNKTVIHRLTGDGAKKELIAPLWSADKKKVLAQLNRVLKERGIFPAEC